jgi:uncharacterized protein (DUF2141 family)
MAKKSTLQIITVILSLLLIYSCANQLPPTGGEVDRIPPEILEVYPDDQTVNFDDTIIEITFSEYVNKRSVQEAVFISPNITGHIEYDWSGKTVEIELPDSLKGNTTYTITVGTEVEDINNKNKMENAFTFAFSTGDKIDRGTITGTVFNPNPGGVMIYAYKMETDTLNPSKQQPDYVTQSGIDGSFKLTGLSNGIYRVFAVRDEFKDFLYDVSQDEFGVPHSEVELSGTDSLFTGMNYQLQIEDTTKPRVFGLTMTDKHHLLIEFSECVDSTRITAENFFIYDSSNQKQTDVNYFFKGRTKKKNYLIAFADTLTDSEQLYLITQNIYDNKNNKLNYEATSFVRNTQPDTTQPELLTFQEQYPNKKVDYRNGYVTFSFTDGFNFETIKDAVKVFDRNGADVKAQLNKIDDSSFNINFESLKPNSEYEIKVNHNLLIDAAGNKTDSIFVHKFVTINNLDFSGISGTVKAADEVNVVVVAQNIAEKKISYSSNNREFNFERVFPGKYMLSVFDDENNNGKYDKGSIYPFEEAEKFVFYPDTLDLKPRWPVGDIVIYFDKN